MQDKILQNLFQYVVLIVFMAFNIKSQDLMYQTFQKKVLVLLQVLQNLFQINTVILVIPGSIYLCTNYKRVPLKGELLK